MKPIYVILVFALNTVVARADFVIQQKVEGTLQNGVITLKIKGDKTRLDMPSERLGEVSIVQDIVACDTIMMIHEKKLARKETGAQFRQRMEQMNSGSTNVATPKAVDTGRAEKVGNYDAEIYTWTNSGGMSGTLWLAGSYPNSEQIRKQLTRLNQSPVRQISKSTTPDTSLLPGVVVKSNVKSPTGKITTTLLSAKEASVDASDFEIPADYHLAGPGEAPGKPVLPLSPAPGAQNPPPVAK